MSNLERIELSNFRPASPCLAFLSGAAQLELVSSILIFLIQQLRAHIYYIVYKAACYYVLPVEAKTRTYHGLARFGAHGGARGGVGQDWTRTEQFVQETSVPRTLQDIENTSPERLPRSTNKRNPM